MPYRTPYGSHYHEKYGCCGATEACGTDGLEPCSICCGDASHGGGGGAPSAAGAGSMPVLGAETIEEDDRGRAGDTEPDDEQPMPSPRDMLGRASAIVSAALGGRRGRHGRIGMPVPSHDGSVDTRLSERAVELMPPPERIRAIPTVLDRAGDASLAKAMGTLAEAATAKSAEELPHDRDLAPALEAGCAAAAELAHALSREGLSGERRKELSCALSSLTYEGIVSVVMRRSSRFPIEWSGSHTLSAAVNQHDMLYAMMALSSPSPRRRFDDGDYAGCVVPALGAIRGWASSGFRSFPRVVESVERLGGDGTAWHGKTSVLVTEADVDDPHVRELMRRQTFKGETSGTTFARGVPGYWKVGTSPAEARTQFEDEVAALVASSDRWDEERARQALIEWDENMLPVLEWLARGDVRHRLMSEPAVDFIDLIE